MASMGPWGGRESRGGVMNRNRDNESTVKVKISP